MSSVTVTVIHAAIFASSLSHFHDDVAPSFHLPATQVDGDAWLHKPELPPSKHNTTYSFAASPSLTGSLIPLSPPDFLDSLSLTYACLLAKLTGIDRLAGKGKEREKETKCFHNNNLATILIEFHIICFLRSSRSAYCNSAQDVEKMEHINRVVCSCTLLLFFFSDCLLFPPKDILSVHHTFTFPHYATP